LTVTAVDAQKARFLLQAGKRPRGSLNRLLRGAHRAGFLVLPGPSRRVTDHSHGPQPDDSAGARLGAVTREGRRFELEHRDYPKGLVVLDAVRVSYEGPQAVSACEFAFELKQGPPVLLERIVSLVELQTALVPARLTDAERALHAAGIEDHQSRSAPGHHLSMESRWQDLGLAHLKALALLLQHFEPRAAESIEPEGVHQMRVTTRRLREALRTFGPVLPAAVVTRLAADLRWLTGLLGEVRDLDVQIGRLADYQKPEQRDPGPALQGYHRYLQKRQRHAHRALVDAIDQSRMADIHRSIQSLVQGALAADDPDRMPAIADAAPPILKRLLGRVRKFGRRAGADCEASQLHKLRIEAKRLRYFLEYVQPVGSPGIQAGIAALTKLQDILGEHQDAYVATLNLQQYRKSAGIARRERKVVKRLLERETGNVEQTRSQFRAEWPAFVRASRTLVL